MHAAKAKAKAKANKQSTVKCLARGQDHNRGHSFWTEALGRNGIEHLPWAWSLEESGRVSVDGHWTEGDVVLWAGVTPGNTLDHDSVSNGYTDTMQNTNSQYLATVWSPNNVHDTKLRN